MENKKTPFFEAISNYTFWRSPSRTAKTVKDYELKLRQFAIYVENGNIEDVIWSDVSKYFQLLRQAGYQTNTFLNIACALRDIFSFYKKQGKIVIDPELIELPRKEYKQPKVVKNDDYIKLLNSIPKNNDPRHIRNLAIIKLLKDTGARIGEILSLNIEDLKEKSGIIRTEKSRGKRPFRQIFWTEDTQKALEKWIQKREEISNKKSLIDKNALFISTCGACARKRLTTKGTSETFRRYAQKAGIPTINAHSFRHGLAHQIIKNGGSGVDVMNILGHSDLSSSTVYTEMFGDELKERYQKILVK